MRNTVRFCPSCGLSVLPESATANDCCPRNALLVYADSIESQRMGPWKYEAVKEEDRPMGKQMQIKGTERKRNPKLAEAMEKYKDLRDKAIKAGNKASVAKEELLDLARSNMSDLVEVDGEYVLVDDETGLELIYTKSENVKVRTRKAGETQETDPDLE